MQTFFHTSCRDLKAHLTGETAPVCQEKLLFMFTTCRSEKESLQSSLLEAQQHISELEIARSRVQAQVHAATQAKEAILGESLVRFVSAGGPAQCSCSQASSFHRATEE